LPPRWRRGCPNHVYTGLKTAVEGNGSPSVTHVLGQPYVAFGTPDHVREVMSTLKEKSEINRWQIGLLFGAGSLLVLPYARWLPLRRNLGQVFHLSNMKGYFDVFVEAAVDFVARVEAHNGQRKTHFEEAKQAGMRTLPTTLLEPVDVDRCAMDLALDVVTRGMFSKDLAIQKGRATELATNLHRMGGALHGHRPEPGLLAGSPLPVLGVLQTPRLVSQHDNGLDQGEAGRPQRRRQEGPP